MSTTITHLVTTVKELSGVGMSPEAAVNDPVFLNTVTGWPIIAPRVSWGGDWVVKVQGVYDGVDVTIELTPRPFRVAMQKKKS